MFHNIWLRIDTHVIRLSLHYQNLDKTNSQIIDAKHEYLNNLW